MDFDNAFAHCIRNGDVNGITSLGIDAQNANELLTCPTPVPQIPGQFFLPSVNYPTPLVYAILCKQDLIVEKLLNIGADPKLKVGNWEPIHYAVASRSYSITRILLANYPNLITSKTQNTGNTPLHIAVSSGEENLVLLLLRFSANPNEFNNSDKTPVFLSEHLHDSTILRDLIIFGGNPDLKNKNGISAKEYAKNNKLEMATTFLDTYGDMDLPSREELFVELDSLEKSDINSVNLAEKIDILEQRISAAEEMIEYKRK